MPFRSFLRGPIEVNIRSFLEKTFMYGTLLWVLVRNGVPLRAAAVLGAVLVFGLRLLQMYLPGRSAEITDAVMVLLLAGLMRVLGPAR
jgi:hypothetical protein